MKSRASRRTLSSCSASCGDPWYCEPLISNAYVASAPADYSSWPGAGRAQGLEGTCVCRVWQQRPAASVLAPPNAGLLRRRTMNEDRPPRVSSAPRCEPSWTKFDGSATRCASGVPLVPYFGPCSSERSASREREPGKSVAVRRAGLGAVRRAQVREQRPSGTLAAPVRRTRPKVSPLSEF